MTIGNGMAVYGNCITLLEAPVAAGEEWDV